MKCLIIVDVQNDFTPGGALAVAGGDEIIETINLIQPYFELVVATQDWHPPHHKSFAAEHAGKKVFETTTLNGLEQVLWPAHCVQGSVGADFHPSLKMDKVEAIFRKGMDEEIDSYSGFYDNGKKKNTGLAGYLRERKIRDVYVCGLAADYCVYYTAKDAQEAGFTASVIEDATRAIDHENFKRCKANLIALGAKIIAANAVHYR